MHFRKVFSFKK